MIGTAAWAMLRGMPRSLEDRWRDLLFGVRVSHRYHERRWQFFLSCNRVVAFLTVFFSTTGAVALLFVNAPWAWVPVLVVAVLGLLDLIWSSAGKLAVHAVLKRDFVLLERRMVASDCSEEALKEMLSARLALEAEEPPIKRNLARLAHNDVLRSMGYPPEDKLRIPRLGRLFAHIADVGPDTWPVPPETAA